MKVGENKAKATRKEGAALNRTQASTLTAERAPCARALCALMALLSVALMPGCGLGGDAGTQRSGAPGPGAPYPTAHQTALPAYTLPEILSPYAAGTAVEENDKAVIDFSNKQDGYIMAKFSIGMDREVRVLITFPDEEVYPH